MQASTAAMEWSTSAASALRPRRIAIAVVSVVATASIGYYAYYSIYGDLSLSGPDPSRRLHRSNAIRRPRRSLRERAPSDASSTTSAESHTDENAADGDTVAEDQNTVEDDWWNNPASAPPARAGQNIVSLLFRVSEDNARRNAYVHRGCACNACGIVPIRGIRYRCANCADFDLCETCESQGSHTSTHIFYKVRVPAPPFGPRQSQPVWYTGEPENSYRKLTKNLMAKLSRETGFERPELEAFWEQWTFMANTEWREDPDELLLAMDRRTFERCLVPSGGYRHTAPNLIHDRMFAFYDTNNDDLIGFSEFLHGLSYRKRKDKLRRIFNGFDMDGDGYVSRKDFLRIFRAYYVLYKQMHRDILEGLDDQALGSSDVHQLVTGRQPLSSFFGREGRVPPARGSRELEGKVVQNGDMVVNSNVNEVVSEDKPDNADRNAVLTSLFPPDMEYYHRTNYTDEDDDLRDGSVLSDDSYMLAYGQVEDGATSPRYLNGLLNPPTGIDELPSLLAGDPRPGDDLFVTDEEGDENDDRDPTTGLDGPTGEDGQPALEPLQGSNQHSTAGRQPRVLRILSQEALEQHRAKVEKAKAVRNFTREKLLERWRRRQFFLDEEEGAAPPEDLSSDPKDVLGHNNPNWEDPKNNNPHVPPSSRSRASSKVRFAEETDDYDVRSNPSTSSRSVPERWGDMDIPDAERDAGKEILYQITQQAYNELLDILFNEKESGAMRAAQTRTEREHYKDLIARTRWEDVKGPTDDPFNEPANLDNMREKSLPELLAESGYEVIDTVDNHESEAHDDISEIDGIDGELPEGTGTLVGPRQSSAEPQQIDEQHRDPTMPQFRPNSAAELAREEASATIPTTQTNTSTPPRKDKGKAPATEDNPTSKKVRVEEDASSSRRSKQKRLEDRIDNKKLCLWKSGQMAEDEARARGGWGRLNFEEFERIFKEEERSDNRLDYLGSWIDFCIP